MSLQYPLLLVLFFALTISPTPFQLPREASLDSTLTSDSLSNLSLPAAIESTGNGFNIHCDGETYGYNPNIADCQDAAVNYLPPDLKTFTFGQRHTGLPPGILPLPYRVMGDRGLCYFQAVLIGDHKTAKASLNMIRRAAAALVVQCATNLNSQGGIAVDIGKRTHGFLGHDSFGA